MGVEGSTPLSSGRAQLGRASHRKPEACSPRRLSLSSAPTARATGRTSSRTCGRKTVSPARIPASRTAACGSCLTVANTVSHPLLRRTKAEGRVHVADLTVVQRLRRIRWLAEPCVKVLVTARQRQCLSHERQWEHTRQRQRLSLKTVEHTRKRQRLSHEGSVTHKEKAVS